MYGILSFVSSLAVSIVDALMNVKMTSFENGTFYLYLEYDQKVQDNYSVVLTVVFS